MDVETKEYYTLCAEFLKLSEVYRRIISQVSKTSESNDLPKDFEKIDFSEYNNMYSWWDWLHCNRESFSDDIFNKYGVLLHLVYLIFQDVHNKPIDLVLERIRHAQISKQSIIYDHVSDGREYLKGKMESYLKECEKRNLALSARDFVERFHCWMDRKSDDVVDLESDTASEFNDEFCYIVKVDVRGERNDIIKEFRKYQSKSNAEVDRLYRNWERFKRIRSFAYKPVEVKSLDSKRKLLGILQDKMKSMSYNEINAKYNLGSQVANSAKEYVKRAKKIVRNIELKGEFMLNDS